MKQKRFHIASLLVVSGLILSLLPCPSQPLAMDAPRPAIPVAPVSVSERTNIDKTPKSTPLMFVENMGQFDSHARFQVLGDDAVLYLADDALWFTLWKSSNVNGVSNRPHSDRIAAPDVPEAINLKLSFVGANTRSFPESFQRLDGHVSYFIGNDPSNWRSDVLVWGGVRYTNLYPNVDLEIYSTDGRLDWRLVCKAGCRSVLPSVRLQIEGADALVLDGDSLHLSTALGDYVVPLLQVAGSDGVEMNSPILAGNQVASPFASRGDYSNSDLKSNAPALIYSSFLGGIDNEFGPVSIAVDQVGNAYVTGYTWSPDFPTTMGAHDRDCGSGGDCLETKSPDAFVVKLDADGSGLVYATFLGGGDEWDQGIAIDVDGTGNAYVAGYTWAFDFPALEDAFDTDYNGDGDAFLVKLSADGTSLVYSTFLGGSTIDRSWAIAVDGNGNAYTTGETASDDFPVTSAAHDMSSEERYFPQCDAFVVKVTADGTDLDYSTILGGEDWESGNGIAVDGAGNAYVTGSTRSSDFPITGEAFDTMHGGGTCGGPAPNEHACNDVFVLKVDADGSTLSYSTFLGGWGDDSGASIAVDESGNAFVTGSTTSPDFPITAEAFDIIQAGGRCGVEPHYYPCTDAFVVKITADGSALVYGAYLGGRVGDGGNAIAVDATGAAYLTGGTESFDFPTTESALDTSNNGGYDVFVARVNADGTELDYSSFLGGTQGESGAAIAIDGNGGVYVTGSTDSPDFPITAGSFDTTYNGRSDIFVAKLTTGAGKQQKELAALLTNLVEQKKTVIPSLENPSVTFLGLSITGPGYDETSAWNLMWYLDRCRQDLEGSTLSSTDQVAVSRQAAAFQRYVCQEEVMAGVYPYFATTASDITHVVLEVVGVVLSLITASDKVAKKVMDELPFGEMYYKLVGEKNQKMMDALHDAINLVGNRIEDEGDREAWNMAWEVVFVVVKTKLATQGAPLGSEFFLEIIQELVATAGAQGLLKYYVGASQYSVEAGAQAVWASADAGAHESNVRGDEGQVETQKRSMLEQASSQSNSFNAQRVRFDQVADTVDLITSIADYAAYAVPHLKYAGLVLRAVKLIGTLYVFFFEAIPTFSYLVQMPSKAKQYCFDTSTPYPVSGLPFGPSVQFLGSYALTIPAAANLQTLRYLQQGNQALKRAITDYATVQDQVVAALQIADVQGAVDLVPQLTASEGELTAAFAINRAPILAAAPQLSRQSLTTQYSQMGQAALEYDGQMAVFYAALADLLAEPDNAETREAAIEQAGEVEQAIAAYRDQVVGLLPALGSAPIPADVQLVGYAVDGLRVDVQIADASPNPAHGVSLALVDVTTVAVGDMAGGEVRTVGLDAPAPGFYLLRVEALDSEGDSQYVWVPGAVETTGSVEEPTKVPQTVSPEEPIEPSQTASPGSDATRPLSKGWLAALLCGVALCVGLASLVGIRLWHGSKKRVSSRQEQLSGRVSPASSVQIEPLLQQGIGQIKGGDVEGGAASLRRIVASSPNCSEAWLWLGWAQAQLGDRRAAEHCFLEAHRLGHPSASQALEWCRSSKGKSIDRA